MRIRTYPNEFNLSAGQVPASKYNIEMGCASCTNKGDGTPAGCKNNGHCATGGCNKLTTFNWLSNMELPANQKAFDCVEIRFKNGRKEFFRFKEEISLHEGDVVVTEANQGYDVGIVSLTGELVRLQMLKKGIFPKNADLKYIKRKASQEDIDKWQEGRAKEADAMFKSRTMAIELDLKMKISDVEYQGDATKATFYYTAEERVDFRELIKKLADSFKVRIEMKQIGMRQEASRLGGIGSCGRELCCSTWLTDFRSVSTSAARYQQLSLNPSKLAGQCGKLKCCLNYELDAYMDELKKFPDTKSKLKTHKGDAFFQKMDIFKNVMWYSYYDEPYDFIELSLDRVEKIIGLNKKGQKPQALKSEKEQVVAKEPVYANVVGQDDLTRFDGRSNNRRKNRPNQKRRRKNKPNNNKGNKNKS